MKTGIIISAFPACGKTYATEKLIEKGYRVTDSDSSNFSWIKDFNGNNTKTRNPDFPANYLNHILNAIYKYDIVFVSSHKDVRDILRKSSLDFKMVIPSLSSQDEWIFRCLNRGNDVHFTKVLKDNWYNWIDDIISTVPAKDLHILDKNEYILDIIDEILEKRE